VDPALAEEIRQRVAWADQAARTPYERQAVINVAWYTLYQAGLEDLAEDMLLAEIERSKQPYYFMVDLADLKQEAGQTAEAIAWLRKAYDTSEGIATRFQWGYSYVSGLLEMIPDDADTIAAATEELLAELDGHPDAIYGRTARILKRLGEKLGDWNNDGRFDAQIAQIQSRVDGLCADLPETDDAVGTCREFMESV
jgi:protein disulfide-isomerase